MSTAPRNYFSAFITFLTLFCVVLVLLIVSVARNWQDGATIADLYRRLDASNPPSAATALRPAR